MRRTRELIVLPLLVVVVGIVWFVLQTQGETLIVGDRVIREDQARSMVERLAQAQTAFHAAEGRYGWLEELRGAGSLDGVTWQTQGLDLVATTPGYRIDVMLPATTSAGEAVALGLRSEERLSERLARKHFAIVARPWGDPSDAWRTWYLDERGRLFVNEGVSDTQTRSQPALPTVLVGPNGGTDPAGLRWWPLDNLPER